MARIQMGAGPLNSKRKPAARLAPASRFFLRLIYPAFFPGGLPFAFLFFAKGGSFFTLLDSFPT
jgi:hypothetical protein